MLDGIIEIVFDIFLEVLFGKVDNSKDSKPLRLLILTVLFAGMIALVVFWAYTAYSEGSVEMAGIIFSFVLLLVIWWIYRCYKIIKHK